MVFPINDLLTCFVEALDLHLKLSAGSVRNSSHRSILHVSAEFSVISCSSFSRWDVLVSAGARRWD